MKPNIEELRKKYMDHPPEGFTSEDIRNMSEDELLDMDYFLNEDDLFSDIRFHVLVLLTEDYSIEYKKRNHAEERFPRELDITFS